MSATLPLALFDGLGIAEMLVIAFVSILVFGGRLPEVMRNLGQSYARFRRALSQMGQPLRDEIHKATQLPPEEAASPHPLPAAQAVPHYPALPGPAAPSEPPAGARPPEALAEIHAATAGASPFPTGPQPRPGPGLDEPPPV